MNVLGLFSGIGGFELGFQRAGFTIAAMCEIEPYAQSVLRRHWPGVPLYADVRELTGARLRADGVHVDVITGGFPCQDISLAGKGAGLAGERSGLWREYLRVIAEVRPAWVVIENVSALRSRGLDTVLRQLAEIGYDAEWHCIPASAVGAPHRRDRVWIAAYPQTDAQRPDADSLGPHYPATDSAGQSGQVQPRDKQVGDARSFRGIVPDPLGGELRQQPRRGGRQDGASASQPREHGTPRDVADALGTRLEGRARLAGYLALQLLAAQRGGAVCHAGRRQAERHGASVGSSCQSDWWFSEPDVGRVANGVPARVDRLRSLGNAVVPQIPEAIALAIRTWELFDG